MKYSLKPNNNKKKPSKNKVQSTKKKKIEKKKKKLSGGGGGALLAYLAETREVRSFSGNLNPEASGSSLRGCSPEAFHWTCIVASSQWSGRVLSRPVGRVMAGRYGYSSAYSSPSYTSYASALNSAPAYYGSSGVSSYYGNNFFGGYSASFSPYVSASKGVVGVTTSYSFNRTELPRTG